VRNHIHFVSRSLIHQSRAIILHFFRREPNNVVCVIHNSKNISLLESTTALPTESLELVSRALSFPCGLCRSLWSYSFSVGLALDATTDDAIATLSQDTTVDFPTRRQRRRKVDSYPTNRYPSPAPRLPCGNFVSSELVDDVTVDTLQGGFVTILNDPISSNNDAGVVAGVDILTNNGAVHKIDTVLDPADGAMRGKGWDGAGRIVIKQR
jgi:hypothetical protein